MPQTKSKTVEQIDYEKKVKELERELRNKKIALQSTLTTVSALYQVSSALSTITDEKKAYEAFLQEVGKLLGAEIGIFYVITDDKFFAATSTYGLKHEEEHNIRGLIKGTWLEKVVNENKSGILFDPKGHATSIIGVDTDYPIIASLVSPIETTEGIKAIVQFNRLYDEAFTLDDERVLRILSSKLTLVLKNIGITKQLQENFSLLQTTLESTADGIIAVSLEGDIRQSNIRFAKMWGIPQSVRTNEKIFKFLSGQLVESGKLFFNNKRLAADFPTELSEVLELNDGRVFDQYAHPQFLNDKLVGWVLSFRDVTERIKEKKLVEEQVGIRTKELKQEQAKLLASNRLMTGMLDNLPVGVFVTDATGKPIIVNKKAGEISARPRRAMLAGKPSSYVQEYKLTREDGSLYPEEELPLTITLKKKIQASKRDIFMVHEDGTKLPLMVISSPVFDINHELELAIIVYQDISDEYYIDRAKTEFVSLASHQLRTPLSAMNWYSEMLMKGYAGKMDATQAEFLAEIYKSSRRMSELVSMLLNVSRIELGSFSIEPVEYDISKLITTVTDEVKLAIANKHMTLEVTCEPKPLKAVIDVKLMDIVLENLLTNAVKYTPENGKITVSATKKKDGSLELAVSDTGYGIPVQEQSKIFSKLFRADNIKVLDTEGTGLGLYMVRSILYASGGDVQFTSAENKGTTFIVRIPPEGMKKKEGRKHLTGLLS